MSDIFLSGVEGKYPPPLLDNRISTEGNVISCLFKDMLLMDENTITKEMFLTKDCYFYFQLLVALRSKGFSNLDEVTIRSNFKEDIINKFEELGGFDTIQHQIDIISVENFEVYYDTLIRENMLTQMYNDHIDILKDIKVGDKTQNMLRFFRRMTSEELGEFWEVRVGDYGSVHSNKVLEEEEITFTDEFIDDCEMGVENGVPFDVCGVDINGNPIPGFKWLSNQIMGFLPGTFSAIGGFSNVGKSSLFIQISMALIHRGEKVLIISNEESATKFKSKFLVWILYNYNRYYKLTKAKLLAGNITDEDRTQIKLAQDYWNKNIKGKLKFISIEDADISVVKKKVRENVLKFGYSVVVYDTMKLEESSMSNQRTDLALVRDSRELHRLAKKYNLIMLASIQLAEHSRGQLALNASVLSNSKQIKEILENLILVRSVYTEELSKDNKKYYCEPYKINKVDGKWIREEYDIDTDAVYKMVYVDKARAGKNTEDTASCFMYKFIGDYTTFREACWCKVKHGQIL